MQQNDNSSTARQRAFPETQLEITETAFQHIHAETEHLEHLFFLRAIEKVDQAILGASAIDQMLKNVSECLSGIFVCDGTWMLYPCDPGASSYGISMAAHRTNPPEDFVVNHTHPVIADLARVCTDALLAGEPITCGPGNQRPINENIRNHFSIHALMFMALRPRTGAPWMFGIHQLTHTRAWTQKDKTLFREIGRRISNGLSSLILLKDLRDANNRFQLLHDTMNEGLCVLDTHDQVAYANHRFCEMIDYPVSEILGQDIRGFFDEPNRLIIEKQITQRKAGKTSSYEVSWLRKDGRTIPTLMSPRPVWDSSGNYDGSFSIITDISEQKRAEAERKRLEQKLTHAQKMEAIGTLAGGIAHDFNNILAIIMGNADLALYTLPENSPITARIEAIKKAGNRAKDLVKHILTFSRTSNHELRLLQPGPIVYEVLTLLRAVIPASIEIIKDIDRNCGLIEGDPIQLHQILMNLATNATQAMEGKNGVLHIHLRRTLLHPHNLPNTITAAPGDYIQLTVEDTGVGIPPEIINRIFDPYFTTKSIDQGSGIGLAVVQGIVEQHHGFIHVESEVGKRTAFDIYFPRKSDGTMPDLEANEPLPIGNEHILFIDDEKMLTVAGEEMLTLLGYSVTAKTDAVDALETFSVNPNRYDVVVTDLSMPKMSGIELSRAFLKIRPDTPIILCTGYSGHLAPEDAKEIGIREMLLKPVMNRDIAKLIRKIMDGKKS